MKDANARVLGLLKTVREFTDLNNPNDSYIILAEALEQEELVAKFKSIQLQHLQLGYLSIELSHKRHRLYEELMAAAKKVLRSAVYQQMYQAM